MKKKKKENKKSGEKPGGNGDEGTPLGEFQKNRITGEKQRVRREVQKMKKHGKKPKSRNGWCMEFHAPMRRPSFIATATACL